VAGVEAIPIIKTLSIQSVVSFVIFRVLNQELSTAYQKRLIFDGLQPPRALVLAILELKNGYRGIRLSPRNRAEMYQD
jgi:hypothetical protein